MDWTLVRDWAPVIAPVVALIGVWLTVRRARLSFEHGQLEARKDRQRDIVAKLIATSRELFRRQELSYLAMTKMSQSDLSEWVNTDSWNSQTAARKRFDELIVHALTEIADPGIRPIIEDLANRWEELGQGEAATILNPQRPDSERFDGLLVVLRRLHAARAVLNDLTAAAVKTLPVELEMPPTRTARISARGKLQIAQVIGRARKPRART
ncbi:hypothetical protein [Prescottella equi]|uniref:hypothetical protein n=1 Tax=Rhodococcus hoagii TaxID=43767 RepID=UPI00384B66D2